MGERSRIGWTSDGTGDVRGELEHDAQKRRTRRELLLEQMDGLTPWAALESRIEPFYPKAGGLAADGSAAGQDDDSALRLRQGALPGLREPAHRRALRDRLPRNRCGGRAPSGRKAKEPAPAAAVHDRLTK